MSNTLNISSYTLDPALLAEIVPMALLLNQVATGETVHMVRADGKGTVALSPELADLIGEFLRTLATKRDADVVILNKERRLHATQVNFLLGRKDVTASELTSELSAPAAGQAFTARAGDFVAALRKVGRASR